MLQYLSTLRSNNDRIGSPEEWEVTGICLFGFTLLMTFLAFILSEGFAAKGIFHSYVFGFSLLPIFLFLIQRYSGLLPPSPVGWLAIGVNGLLLLALAWYPETQYLVKFVPIALIGFIFLKILAKNLHWTPRLGWGPLFLSWLIFAGVLLGFLSTFVDHMLFDYFEGFVVNVPHFGGIPAVLAIVYLLLSLYCLWNSKDMAVNTMPKMPRWTTLICYSPILLFSIQGSYDLDHYDAFIGPAIAVMHGQIPLYDVFQQYGLSYLIFAGAFTYLPNTYAVAASIVSVINIIFYILYLFILRELIRSPKQFALIGITSIFGIYFCSLSSPNILPSGIGLRYLPALFYLFYLIKGYKCRFELGPAVEPRDDKWDLFFLYLNAFYSLECLCFYTAISSFNHWLQNHSLKSFFRHMARLIIQLAIGFAVFYFIFLIIFKHFPRFDIYFQFPFNYVTGNNANEFFAEYINPFTRRYLFFLPMALVSILLFYFSLFPITPITTKNKSQQLQKLYLVNFSSIVFFIYVAVHSFVIHIKYEWPLFILPFFGVLYWMSSTELILSPYLGWKPPL